MAAKLRRFPSKKKTMPEAEANSWAFPKKAEAKSPGKTPCKQCILEAIDFLKFRKSFGKCLRVAFRCKKRSVKGPSLKDVQRSIRAFRNSPMAIIDLQSPQSLGDTEREQGATPALF